ncbi:MAG TPA: helix-turn-helix transcriptional regulator [Anaerolineae bacterium]
MPDHTLDFSRLSDPPLLIMASLAGGAKHGYAMMQDIRQFSGQRLEPGTLYGALTRLEARGWIEPLPSEERRRPYRLTAAGAAALAEQLRQLERVAATGLRRLAEA